MPGQPWTPAEDALVDDALDKGIGLADILHQLPDRSIEAIQMRIKRRKAKTIPISQKPDMQPAERRALESSAAHAKIKQLEQQIADMATAIKGNRLEVLSSAEPPLDPGDAWRHAEQDSARRIAFYRERSRFQVDFEKTDAGLPIGVCFVSDQHISPEQYQLYEWYLSIFAPKIVALISGNHDAWTDQIAGIDMVQEIARRQRLCYSPAEARIDATVGGVVYRLACRHQYRFNSSFNLLHTVKQWWRMGEEAFDIGVICHHHEAAIEPFFAHGLERWGARPGAYQVGSSYSRQYGFNDARPTCPTFILYPGERDIIGFQDIRKGVRFLKSERGQS